MGRNALSGSRSAKVGLGEAITTLKTFWITPTKIESVIDDDGITSICLWWGEEQGSYFRISKETGCPIFYCEFGNQTNGLRPRTLTYKCHDQGSSTTVEFSLEGSEMFEKSRQIQKIMAILVDDMMTTNAKATMRSLLGHGLSNDR